MAQNELHLKVTLRIYSDDDQRCFGPGIATLLQRVRDCTTIPPGRSRLYGNGLFKAWRIIRTAETVFGCKLLSSTIGGAHGGGAVLTPEAGAFWRPMRGLLRRCGHLRPGEIRGCLPLLPGIWTIGHDPVRREPPCLPRSYPL